MEKSKEQLEKEIKENIDKLVDGWAKEVKNNLERDENIEVRGYNPYMVRLLPKT